MTAFIIGVIVGAAIIGHGIKLRVLSNIRLDAKRDSYLIAADIIKERADFELYDTEGTSGARLDRARPLFEVELELRSHASKIRENRP
jgi:hypothetical protein